MGMDNLPRGSERHAEALDALHQLIQQSPGRFSLSLVVCDDTALRSRAAVELQRRFSAVDMVPVWPYTEDVFEQVHAHSKNGPYDAVFVSGLDDAIRSDGDHAPLYRALDASPRRWKAWFACPILFWVDQLSADILRQQARDFWEWQTHVFRLDGGTME